VTFPAPRYTNQATLKPVAALGVPRAARPAALSGIGIGRDNNDFLTYRAGSKAS
jgi:hypothetical protein